MDVKTRYKQTEAGVIPEEWEVRPFQSLATLERGKFSARPRNDPRYYGGAIPFIQTGDVKNSHGRIKAFSQTLNREGLKVSKLFPRGTLFFTIAANIGDVGFASFDAACPDSLVAITTVNGIDKRWLAYELSIRKPSFEKLASQNAQSNINLEKLRPYLLPVPTRAEQEAIAEALGDADALIESLERLLAKKRQIKQGAMQELLTGQRRLPGFSGEWEVNALREVCVKIQDGTHFSPALGGRDFLYVTSKNIGFGTLDVSSAAMISSSEHSKIYQRCDVAKGDLLLTKDGANTGNAALNTIDEPFSLLSSVAMLRFDNRRHVAGYFLYQILSQNGQEQIKEQMSGNAITRLTLQKIRSLHFSVAPLPEQSAIATILSDMDAEIAALEAKLAKTRQIKQGMMQELLTGRIRLV